MRYVLTGGFARGYRTYIMAGVGVVSAVAAWAVGDMSTVQALHALQEIALSGSVAAARAALG